MALRDGQSQKAGELLNEVVPRLQDYLEVVMGADENSAKECVQETMLRVFERIRNEEIKDDKYIFSYLLKTCRHRYMRYYYEQHWFESFKIDQEEALTTPAEQLDNLFDKERYKILKVCLDELNKKSREFILYFIRKPDTSTKEAAKLFKLSGGNVRTRKTRIKNQLHDCYRRKSQM